MPPATAPRAGSSLELAAPVVAAAELAALRAELATLASERVMEEIWEAREPVAVEASLAKLEMSEEASLWTDEAAEVISEPMELVAEPTTEVRSEPMEEARDAMSEGAPPTAEVTREMMESTWALATPAASTAVAMVEKRILVVVVVRVVWVG
jgi:hypothetical protein